MHSGGSAVTDPRFLLSPRYHLSESARQIGTTGIRFARENILFFDTQRDQLSTTRLRGHDRNMDNAGRIARPKRAPDAVAVFKSSANKHSCPAGNKDSRLDFHHPHLQQIGANQLEKQALQVEPDSAILRLARVLARQAAREDHARECADKARENETCRDLRPVLDRSSG
jgi:hypothetical protein